MKTYRNSQFMAGIETWQDACQCQSLKIGELFGTIHLVNYDSFRHLKSCGRDSILVTLTQFKTNRMTHKEV